MKNQLTSAIISLVLAATMTTPMYVFMVVDYLKQRISKINGDLDVMVTNW